MKASTLSRTAVLLCVVLLIIGAAIVLRSSDNASTKRHSADLEYLKSVNSVAHLKDPELLFVLMMEFANSNLQGEGADFFSARLTQFEPQLTPVQKSIAVNAANPPKAEAAAPSQ